MAQALIRKLRDETVEAYRASARNKGRSLEAELREVIEATSHSVYDCLYLALAVREHCQLVTTDKKFRAALARVGMTSIEQPL